MDEALERMAHEIGSSFRSRARRFAFVSRFAKWILVSCSAAATAAHFGGEIEIVRWLGIFLSVIILLSGVILLFLDEDASEELEKARSAIEIARESERNCAEIIRDIDTFEKFQTRANELYLAVRSMREVIEKSIQFDQIDVHNIIASMLEAAKRSLTIASGFSLDHHYTICVYEARRPVDDGKRTKLHCVGHIRAVNCELANARVWDAGTGIVGIAFSNAQEFIVPNMAAREFARGFPVGQKKADDDKLYKSFAAVPIMISGNTDPWGAVVATSDRADHFSADDQGVQPEAIRALAGMLGLALASKQKLDSVRTTVNKGRENVNAS